MSSDSVLIGEEVGFSDAINLMPWRQRWVGLWAELWTRPPAGIGASIVSRSLSWVYGSWGGSRRTPSHAAKSLRVEGP